MVYPVTSLPASAHQFDPIAEKKESEEAYSKIATVLQTFPFRIIDGINLCDLGVMIYCFCLRDYSKDAKTQDAIRLGLVNFLYQDKPFFFPIEMEQIASILTIESKAREAFLILKSISQHLIGDKYIISKKTFPALASKIEEDDQISSRRSIFFTMIRAIGIYAKPYLNEALEKELKDLEIQGILNAKTMNPSEFMHFFKEYTICLLKIYNYLDDKRLHFSKAFPFFQRILSKYFEENSFQLFLKSQDIPCLPKSTGLDNCMLAWIKFLTRAHKSVDKWILDILVKLSFSFQYPMLLELIKKGAPAEIYEELALLKCVAWKNLPSFSLEESSPYNTLMVINLSFDFCVVIRDVLRVWHAETIGVMGFIGCPLPKDYMKIREELDSRFHALQICKESLKDHFLISKQIFDFFNFFYFASLKSLDILVSDRAKMHLKIGKQYTDTIDLVIQISKFITSVSYMGKFLIGQIKDDFELIGYPLLEEMRGPLDVRGSGKKREPILNLPVFRKIEKEIRVKSDLSVAFLSSLQKYEESMLLFKSLLLDAEPSLYRALCIHVIRSMAESLELAIMLAQGKKHSDIRTLRLLIDDPLDEDSPLICFLDPIFTPKEFAYYSAVSQYSSSTKPDILELINLPKIESVNKILILSEKVLDILYAYTQENDFEIEEFEGKITTPLFEVDGIVEEIEPGPKCEVPSVMRYMPIRNYLRSQLSLEACRENDKIKDAIDSLDVCQQLLELITRKGIKDSLILDFLLKAQEDLLFRASVLRKTVRLSPFLPLEKETLSREMVLMPPIVRHIKVLERVVSYSSSASK
jgi:hypothetical protein